MSEEPADLPAHRIPVQHFNCIFAGSYWQVGHHLSIDQLAALRRIALGGMKNGEHQRRIPLLFFDKSKQSERDEIALKSGEHAEARVVIASGPPVTVEGVAGAMIVLVPVDETEDTELFRRDQSDLDGTFTLPGVLPGRYIAVAIEDGWRLEWGEAAVLGKYLVKGVAVEVGAGGARTLKLPEALAVQAR